MKEITALLVKSVEKSIFEDVKCEEVQLTQETFLESARTLLGCRTVEHICITCGEHVYDAWIDEEGKLKNLPPNVCLPEHFDYVAGNMLITVPYGDAIGGMSKDNVEEVKPWLDKQRMLLTVFL